MRWVTGAAYFGVAAAIIIGVDTLAIHRDRAATSGARPPASPGTLALQASAAPVGSSSAAIPAAPAGRVDAPRGRGSMSRAATAEIGSRRQDRPAVAAVIAPASRGRIREPRVSAADLAALRNAAEHARFRAGWARIEAERREAGELAGEKFGAGRAAEAEGQRYLAAGQFAQALSSFDVAAGLYREAENVSRETRLERLRLSAPSS
jgi:hypothetical protein